jgi:hypothetical protein
MSDQQGSEPDYRKCGWAGLKEHGPVDWPCQTLASVPIGHRGHVHFLCPDHALALSEDDPEVLELFNQCRA